MEQDREPHFLYWSRTEPIKQVHVPPARIYKPGQTGNGNQISTISTLRYDAAIVPSSLWPPFFYAISPKAPFSASLETNFVLLDFLFPSLIRQQSAMWARADVKSDLRNFVPGLLTWPLPYFGGILRFLLNLFILFFWVAKNGSFLEEAVKV